MDNVLTNLNDAIYKLYSVIEKDIYKILDKIVFIDSEIFYDQPLKLILKEENTKYIFLVINIIVFLYFIYFCLFQLITVYNGNKRQSFSLYILKMIMIILIVSNSYEMVKSTVSLVSLFTETSKSICYDIAKEDIQFENLNKNLNSTIELLNKETTLTNSVFYSIFSYVTIWIFISFSVRYVAIIICIILTPFFIITLLNSKTKFIFNIWFKYLIIHFIVQPFINFIIIVPIISKGNSEDSVYHVVLIGTMFLLYRFNDILNKIILRKD